MSLFDRIRSPLSAAGGDARAVLMAAGPTIAAFALVLLIAAQLASLAWRLYASPAESADQAPVAADTAVPVVDVAGIVNAHLFGIAAADPGAAPAEASGNLVLAGTLAGRVPEQGWAILGPSQQAARVYATGTTLPGGARLVAVYADRVILERAGRREYLSLPRLSGGARPAAGVFPPPPTAQLPPDGVRDVLAQPPAAASEILRPQPVFAGGQLRGYRVYPGRNRQQFTRLGLLPGDLVTAVNGAPLEDPGRGLEALQGLAAGGMATLTVDRNGQVRQLTVDIASASQELMPEGAAEQMPQGEVAE
jgi:general secretion pathway protein C